MLRASYVNRNISTSSVPGMFLSLFSLGCINRIVLFLFQKSSKGVCSKGKKAAGVLCEEKVSGRHMMAAGVCQFLLFFFFKKNLCHYFAAIVTQQNSDSSATF